MREKWRWILALHFLLEMCLCFSASSLTDPNDWAVLQEFIKGLTNSKLLGWNGDDPCGNSWPHLQCQGSHIIGIQVPMIGLQGTITPELNKLSLLQYIAFQFNSFSGPLPSLNGLKFLKTAYLNSNNFDTIPSDFFKGLTALTAIYLDHNPLNSSTGWVLPADIKESSQLLNLSLTNTSLSGTIPDFLGGMSSLKVLNLAYNRLSGGVPQSFSSSNLYQFQANNMAGPTLTGPIDAVGYMTSLTQLWLQVNQITGTIPVGLSNAVSLQNLKLNDNDLSGPIPDNFTQLPLSVLTLDNNQLVGRIPKFGASVKLLDLSGNNFCQDKAGADCAPEVNALLSFIGAVGYPVSIVSSWKGNDPCQSWTGVVCDASSGHVSVINLSQSKLSGTISPSLADLTYLTVLKLNDNNLTGSIPQVLTTMKYLKNVDLSNNQLTGPLVQFGDGVTVNLDGNVMLNSGNSSQTPVSSPNPNSPPSNSQAPASSSSPRASNGTSVSGNKKKSSISVVAVAAPIAGAVSLVLVGALLFFFCKNKGNKFLRVQSPNTVLVHPRNSASDPESVKIVVNEGSVSSVGSQNDVQVVEAGNLMISIQVLRNATKNFSQDSVLGRGGFGVVYKGVLEDGTHIAVKRMESSVVSSTGLNEFQAEIAVLTKVRHRHLVALLGYCIDGNEKLLVYEYLPNGTLGQHLFEFERLNWKPLEWKRRLSIALDVARGMEYLHSLAHKSFIHRDLKPSNILLDDSFRAKVSDFGLVKLAPDGKYSVETRLAGTFGYLAPEYAVTGRVTTKSDVFSFGVVLMELLTGRRALDESQSEENLHLVTWFRRMNSNKESFGKMIDTKIEEQDDEETFQSLRTVAELAGHCTAREPYQRPDMGHAVNVLAPLVEKWKPTDMDSDDDDGIDLNLTLPQALKKWQLSENGNSSTTFDDSQASLPTLPNGFPESFTSADGR